MTRKAPEGAHEQDAEQVRAVLAGERGAFEALWESHRRLVEPMVERYAQGTPHMRHDLLQVAKITLWRKAADWDPARGLRYWTFASYHVRANLRIAYLRGAAAVAPRFHKGGRVAVPLCVSFDGDNRTQDQRQRMAELLPDPDEGTHAEPSAARRRAHAALACEWALSQVSAREAHVLRQSYLEDRSYAEVGEGMGVTRERIRQIADRAMHLVRRRAAGMGHNAEGPIPDDLRGESADMAEHLATLARRAG